MLVKFKTLRLEVRILIGVLILISVIVLFADGPVTYNSTGFVLYSLSATLLLIKLCHKLQNTSISHSFVMIGKDSYAIYLLHMPFAGLVSNICSRFSVTRFFVLGQPLLILLLVLLALSIVKKTLTFFHMEKLGILFGFR